MVGVQISTIGKGELDVRFSIPITAGVDRLSALPPKLNWRGRVNLVFP